MNEVPWMILVEKSDLGLSAHQILNERHENIKPISSFVHFRKVERFGTVESDSFGWFAVCVQFLQIFLGELTVV
jgi:hypothetical protein